MKLAYMGFRHETTAVRLYSFEGVVAEGTRKDFLVTADIALLTKHHIRIQEVPMMCLRLLESSAEAEPQLELLVLTEADMTAHVHAKAAEAEKAASKRKKRPFNLGGHLKTGQLWSLQNRPVDLMAGQVILYLANRYSGKHFRLLAGFSVPL